MNFLAHLYLSGNSDAIKIGNFIADAVKGKELDLYEDDIRAGIVLHRKIDSFTDNHPIVKSSKRRLYPNYGKYASVIVDIFYDHFLSSQWRYYAPNISYSKFVQESYQLLLNHQTILPSKVRFFLPKMIEMDWLGGYSSLDGISRTLQGMSERATNPNKINFSIDSLKADHEKYKNEFNTFFPSLIEFVKAVGVDMSCYQ